MLRDHHRIDVLRSRGIKDEIIDAVPTRYQSFDRGDHERFFELMGFRPMIVRSRGAWKGKVTQASGIVVSRFPFNGGNVPPPYARLDGQVRMGEGKPTHYVYRPSYPTKHIDVHPIAATELESGKPIYLCLEGCLKADAVLSAGGISISTASVTMWKDRDLERLLPILRAAPMVFVVPDSDYFLADPDTTWAGWFNPMVRWQTRLCAQWLSQRKVAVEIRAPWLGVAAGKVGVDDFLARGYQLNELARHTVFFDDFDQQSREGVLVDAIDLTRAQKRILKSLLRSQGTYGILSPQHIADSLGVHRDTVLEAYKRLIEIGVMRLWKGKTVAGDGKYYDEPHRYQIYALDQRQYVDYLKAAQRPPTPPPHGPKYVASPAESGT